MTDVNGQNATTREGRVRAIVDEVIQGTPLYVVDLDVRGRKGSQVVDVFVESDGPLGVAELARVSREVGFLLDTEEVIQGGYSLNVSSPGVDRSLKMPRQFKKNLHRKLKVNYEGAAAEKTEAIIGELTRVDEESIEVAPAEGDPVKIAYERIVEARVQLPW